MTADEFRKWLKAKDPTPNMLPNGTSAQEALDILAEHFLGNYRIDGYPAKVEQANSEVVCRILELYPRGKIRRIKSHYDY